LPGSHHSLWYIQRGQARNLSREGFWRYVHPEARLTSARQSGSRAVSQLTSDGTRNYSFDLNGNRTNSGYQTGTANQLTTDGVWNFTYDNEGNLIKAVRIADNLTWTYGYDNLNRMTSAIERQTDGGTLLLQATYLYDPFGNRIEKDVWTASTGTVTTRFVYDGADVWGDVSSSNSLQMRYFHGDTLDQLFARMSGNGSATAWYLTDHLGSVRNLVDGSGNLQDTISYDPFGNVLSESNSSFGDRYKYTGRELDSETNLQYNRSRYYDAAHGRWISQDPIGFAAGDANLYRYVANQPTGANDPIGLVHNFVVSPVPDGEGDTGSGSGGGGGGSGGGIGGAGGGGNWNSEPLQPTQVMLGIYDPSAPPPAAVLIAANQGVPLPQTWLGGALIDPNAPPASVLEPALVDPSACPTVVAFAAAGANPTGATFASRPFDPLAFGRGLGVGLASGGIGLVTGIGRLLWDLFWHPIDTPIQIFKGAENLVRQLIDGQYGEAVKAVSPELYELFTKWNKLDDEYRGYLVGRVIAELGPTIVTGAGILKLLKKLKALKAARQLKRLAVLEEAETEIATRLAAGAAEDVNGLTRAGRALEKHGSRPGSAFPRATGNVPAKNAQGQEILKGILRSPNKQIRRNRFGGQDIFDLTTGRGVRFDANGNMIGFLEP
jgi:RHS repeat-associated protein